MHASAKALRNLAKNFRDILRDKIFSLDDKSWTSAVPAAIHKARGSIVEVDGIYLKMDRKLSNLMVNVLRRNHHAQEERALILPILTSDDILMELGGGIGHTSVRFSKIIGSERVFTFEANPDLEPIMRENFRLNGVQPTAQFCVLGHKEGQETFTIAKHYWASSLDPRTPGRKVQVPAHQINEKIEEINPTIFVVDIEGGEQTLFDGINFHNIRRLMLELHRRKIGEAESERILELISDAGFVVERKLGNCILFIRTPGAAPADDQAH